MNKTTDFGGPEHPPAIQDRVAGLYARLGGAGNAGNAGNADARLIRGVMEQRQALLEALEALVSGASSFGTSSWRVDEYLLEQAEAAIRLAKEGKKP